MRPLALLLFMVLAILSPMPAHASPVSLSDSICVLRGAENQSAHQVLARKGEFDCSREALLSEGNEVWLYMDVERAVSGLSDPALSLRMSYHGAITVAPVYNGLAVSQRYDPKDLVGKFRVPNRMVFPLKTEPQRPEAILIRIERAWDLTNWRDIEIVSEATIDGKHLKGALTYALLSGLLLTPLIFTALMYFTLRIDFLPYHFGMVSFALIYALSWSGLIFALPVELTPIGRSYLNHITIAAAFACACYLTRSLCDEDAIGRFWSKLLPVAGIVPVIVACIIMLAAPNFSHIGSVTYHLIFMLPLIAILGALLTGALRGHFISRLQLLAWSPMILYVFLRILKGLGLIDGGFITQYGLYPSIISEALLTTCVIGYRVHIIQKAHQKALKEQIVLRGLATTDALTGALNRRAFIEHFEQTVAAAPSGRVMSLILVDIDHFKLVNDTHGHLVGDTVLKEVVDVLQAHCRAEDMLARFGGEEFCLLLSTPTKAVADVAAERMRAAVEACRFEEGCDVTISLGLITVDLEQATSFDQWYSAADKALYAAKTKGRNRVQRSYWSPAPLGTTDDGAYASAWVPKTA